MFGLSEKTRWVIFTVGLLLVALGILEHHNLLDEYPIIKLLVFPYIWVIGCILIFVAYGFEDSSRNNSGGVDGAPGLGEKKDGPFGDGGFWGGGDGSSGGGGD
jgi:uncharacterized membrane protein YgcG